MSHKNYKIKVRWQATTRFWFLNANINANSFYEDTKAFDVIMLLSATHALFYKSTSDLDYIIIYRLLAMGECDSIAINMYSDYVITIRD